MGLYLRQLRAGRDFAKSDHMAAGMSNFVYLLGDEDARECVVVDPAWDVDGILAHIDQDNMKLSGVLATHYHPDHVGGSFIGFDISGLAELIEKRPVPIYVNPAEVPWLVEVTGLSRAEFTRKESGERVTIGRVPVMLLHTPGHTPGSQCFLAGSNLISGDTLFINGCGRIDLPGGDPDQLYRSLTQVLAKLPDSTKVYPGHDYAAESVSTIGDEKRPHGFLNRATLDQWMGVWGRNLGLGVGPEGRET